MASRVPPGVAPIMATRRPTWFAKDRKWFLPVVISAAILLVGSFIYGLFSAIEHAFSNTYPYKLAVKTAIESLDVAALIGSPAHIGRFSTGEVHYFGSEGNANLRIPISGPTGKGDIIVAANKHANRWTFESFEVDVEGHEQPIQLKLPDTVADARPSKAITSPSREPVSPTALLPSSPLLPKQPDEPGRTRRLPVR
jgi:hypothetical protein